MMKSLLKTKNQKDDYYSHDRIREMNDEIREIVENILPKIQVWGVGGMGNNVINRLMTMSGERAEIIAVNTDSQHLGNVMADKKLLIGKKIATSCNNLKNGELSAIKTANDIKQILKEDLVFIIYGLGGNTGAGVGPVIAKLAQEMGALTLAVCTLPFRMEGRKSVRNAIEGLKRIRRSSNTLIIVPNESLLHFSPNLTLERAFEISNEIIARGIKGIIDLILEPQLINIDFGDIRRMIANGSIAMISYGESNSSSNKVEEAVTKVLENPLLYNKELSTIRQTLICIYSGDSLKLSEAHSAILGISAHLNADAEIIWGALIEPELGSSLRIICIFSESTKSNIQLSSIEKIIQ
ncbi:MAG: cell division protein FtsZ [Candidatus Hermodarchaeota archaeon]